MNAVTSKKSLWVGLELLRTSIISSIDHDRGNFINKSIEPHIEYRLNDRWITYVNFNYTELKRNAFRNLRYWNETYTIKLGAKRVLSKGAKAKYTLGLGALYYNFHEVGKYIIGGSYYGTIDVLPYNIRLPGVGIEVPFNVKWYLNSQLAFRVDLSQKIIFTPEFSTVKQNNTGVRERPYVGGTGLFSIRRNLQVNFGIGFGLTYRFDWK